ncbi:MAG: trigger factor [Clostridiales Family XIII bacterium]|jgi:trigger factor|nr:trigger factor [Clostridiales Family XIII bacterium]
MKATFAGRENNVVTFTMGFEPEEFEGAQVEVYKRDKDKFHIDGFRKGKAPRRMIEQHYGEQIFWEEAVDGLLQNNYTEALGELGIEPINHPEVEIDELAKGAGFTVTLKVEVAPEVEVKDYTGVTIKDFKLEVTDETVEKTLTEIRKRSARHIDSEGPAASGDTVTIDFTGFVDGKEFDGGKAEGHRLKLGSGSFIAGFEDQLIGAVKGQELEVNVTFPEDYPEETLKGKPALFQVKVNEIRAEELPELTDEFAQDISEFETFEEFKADLRKQLEEEAAERTETEKRNMVLDKVYEANPIDVPKVMIEDEMNIMMNDFIQGIQSQGVQFEVYLELLGKTQEEVRETFREEAQKRVALRLIIKAVVKEEGFTVTPEEVEAEITNMASKYGMDAEKFKEYFGASQQKGLEEEMLNRKGVDYMYEMAIVEPADAVPAE